MKTLDEVMTSLGAGDIKTRAFEKTDAWTREMKRLVRNFKKLDLNLADLPLVENLKDNVATALTRMQGLEVVAYARDKVAETKNQVFGLLNIPSQEDVDHLTRKVVALEKKVRSMSRQRSAARK